jgi:hypothetical protein
VGQVTVAVGGELEKVAAIGAQGVPGGVGVLGIDEEVVQVSGERMLLAELFDDHRIHDARPPFARLPDNRESNRPRWEGGFQLTIAT